VYEYLERQYHVQTKAGVRNGVHEVSMVRYWTDIVMCLTLRQYDNKIPCIVWPYQPNRKASSVLRMLAF